MKILYTGAFRFPKGDAAAARVLNNAKIFATLGHNVEFLSFGGDAKNNEYQGFKYRVSEDIDIKHKLEKIKFMFCQGHKALKIIRSDILKYDAIIAYNPGTYFTIVLQNLCHLNHIYLILDSTEWYSRNDFAFGAFNPLFYVYQFGEFFIKTRVKNVLPISRFLANHLKKSPNIFILPPLVDLEEEKWGKKIEKQREFQGPILIYAGNPGKNKDRLDIVLNAMERAVNNKVYLKLMVLGVPEISYKNEQQHLTLSPYIELLGRVPQDEVPAYYKMADFSILLRDISRKTNAGFSTKLVESVAAGVPPILNISSNIQDYFVNSVNSFILNEPDEKELFRLFVKLQNVKSKSLSVIKMNVKNTSKKYFDYNSYISSINSFIENLEY